MPYDVIDADGHVTETWEQIARNLEEPYRRRPLLTPFFPQSRTGTTAIRSPSWS